VSIAEIPIEAAVAVAAGQSTEDRAEFLRNLTHSKAFIFGATILGFWILAAIFGNLLVPHNPLAQNLSNINQAPTLSHWFGTDSLGRDMVQWDHGHLAARRDCPGRSAHGSQQGSTSERRRRHAASLCSAPRGRILGSQIGCSHASRSSGGYTYTAVASSMARDDARVKRMGTGRAAGRLASSSSRHRDRPKRLPRSPAAASASRNRRVRGALPMFDRSG
jgi:hypothetical protein